jgi:pteridine reductase
MTLAGRRALVTGGAVRLGRGIALGLADRGAQVAIGYHASREGAAETAAELARRGAGGHAFQADVGDVAAARRLVDEAAAALGGLDVLVHAASAAFVGRPALEVDETLWDAALDSTLKGGFFCAQSAARHMGEAGGTIIFITDVAGIEPWPSFAAHGAAKAGLIYLTKALARAWGPGIRVCGVAPGTVLLSEGASEATVGESAAQTALDRVGTPDDVVKAVAYLLDAQYVTGTQLVVDGGRLLL